MLATFGTLAIGFGAEGRSGSGFEDLLLLEFAPKLFS